MTLLEITKVRLGYLTDDETINELIKDLLNEGKSFLSSYCSDLDFENPTRERTLLITWVRYAMSNATYDFNKNYRSELIALSNRGRINAESQKE